MARGDDPLRRGFGPTVRRLRTERGLTRRQLVGRCDSLSDGYLAKIEQGARFPSEPVMAELARALDVALPELLRLADQAAGPSRGTAEEVADPSAVSADALPRPAASSASSPSEAAGIPEGFERLVSVLPAADEPDARATVASVEAFARLLVATRPQRGQLDAALQLARAVLAGDHPEPDRLLAAVDLVLAVTRDAGRELTDEQLQRMLEYAQAGVRDPGLPREPVAAMPEGGPRYVWAKAIGEDTDGLWVDPLASTRSLGLDSADPRVQRLDDGRVFVDLSRLEAVELGARDPARHRVRATAVRRMPDEEVPFDSYVTTVLAIEWSRRATIVVEWAPMGIAEGEFPAATQSVHVVTAWNPAPRVLPEEINEARNERLRGAIEAAGLRWVPATGSSANPRERWQEPGYALVDAGRAQAVELGRQFEQAAVFEWTPNYRAVVRCDRADTPLDEAVLTHGWRATWR